ncbi:MAG: FAD-binding oxidoreductase [Actinobacteria bacterium]|nr:FAD-binding oxidoreductase [Actinomycetota bacterium]
MAYGAMMVVSPSSYEEAAAALREASASGKRVRFRGGGTKLDWGNPVPDPEVEISTSRLDRIIDHNAGDLTAVVQAGVPLRRLQDALAERGQMLALDPPPGADDAATVGGILAAGDSGPLRHSYGGPRDLVLGMTVALSDGTIARSGGRVIKNVAGYDLAKLFTGSLGTLGMILEVAVRLHPLPRRTATAIGECDGDPGPVARVASELAHLPLEAERLDAAALSAGRVQAQFAGAAADERAVEAAEVMRRAGLAATVEDGEGMWAAVRSAQRPAGSLVLRVSGLQRQLEAQLGVAGGSSIVARAASGLAWIAVSEGSVEAVESIRRELSPSPSVVLDAPREVREKVSVWGEVTRPAVSLMRNVKSRFDPAGACNPGVFVGGI